MDMDSSLFYEYILHIAKGVGRGNSPVADHDRVEQLRDVSFVEQISDGDSPTLVQGLHPLHMVLQLMYITSESCVYPQGCSTSKLGHTLEHMMVPLGFETGSSGCREYQPK